MSVVLFPVKDGAKPKPDQLWRDYVSASTKAQRSKKLEDGLMAGRAWSRFLKAFE